MLSRTSRYRSDLRPFGSVTSVVAIRRPSRVPNPYVVFVSASLDACSLSTRSSASHWVLIGLMPPAAGGSGGVLSQ